MTVPTTVRVAAHAKINLVLRILAREDDGYHGLETLFARLALHDELVAERRDGEEVSLTVLGDVDTGPTERNLAVRAAEAVRRATGRRFGVHLTLTKQIPAQAGLGGGSADAAAALHAVNALAGDAVPRHELLQLGAQLGADVPFCLLEAPLALAWGHGERLLRLPALPSMPALLLLPPDGVSTAEAYGWVDEARAAGGRRGALALDLDALGGWGSVGRMACNDFESVVFARRPAIRAAFDALAATAPFFCRLSGSGSALVALYRAERDRDAAAAQLGRKHGRLIATATLASPPGAPVAS